MSGQSYSGIQVKAQGLNLEIANSIIRNSESNGIYVELGAHYVDINNNSIHHNSGSGIRFQSAASSLKDNVVVGSGAQILGPVVVGKNAKVGANAVVTKDVPENAVMVGIPAKNVGMANEEFKPYAVTDESEK